MLGSSDPRQRRLRILPGSAGEGSSLKKELDQAWNKQECIMTWIYKFHPEDWATSSEVRYLHYFEEEYSRNQLFERLHSSGTSKRLALTLERVVQSLKRSLWIFEIVGGVRQCSGEDLNEFFLPRSDEYPSLFIGADPWIGCNKLATWHDHIWGLSVNIW